MAGTIAKMKWGWKALFRIHMIMLIKIENIMQSIEVF